jgi:hypothetical protein
MLHDMRTASTMTRPSRRGHQGSLLASAVALILRAVGTLLLAVLVLLEPIVQPVLCAIALLALGTAFLFRFLVGDPVFPFSGMLALSIICILLLALYYRLVRLLCFDG